MEHLIDGEQAYPIYSFNFRWSQDGEWDPEYSNWHEGLQEGRIWNGNGFSQMYKEEKTQEEIDLIAKEYIEKCFKESKEIKNPELVKCEAKFKEYEVWDCTWFEHFTFDIGQTNEEALESFEKFVRRKENLNYISKRKTGNEICCLMGAEDRWRWHGNNLDGSRNEDSQAPCRCKFCKEQGVIRIGH